MAEKNSVAPEAGGAGALSVVRRHRRHVELSPGVGADAQRYALAVCDDIIADLPERSIEQLREDVRALGMDPERIVADAHELIARARERAASTRPAGAPEDASEMFGKLLDDLSRLRTRVSALEGATKPLVCPRDHHTLGCLCACPICTQRRIALASGETPSGAQGAQEKGGA